MKYVKPAIVKNTNKVELRQRAMMHVWNETQMNNFTHPRLYLSQFPPLASIYRIDDILHDLRPTNTRDPASMITHRKELMIRGAFYVRWLRQDELRPLQQIFIKCLRTWQSIKNPEDMWQTRININFRPHTRLFQFAVHDYGVVPHRIQTTCHWVRLRKISEIRGESWDIICIIRICINGLWKMRY